MPVTYAIHDSHALMVAEGSYTFEEIVDGFECLVEESPRRLPLLVDARRSGANPPFDEMVQTAMFSLSIADDIGPRIALVVQGALRYGLARMLSSLAGVDGRLKFRTYLDMDAATAWLLEQPAQIQDPP